MCVCVLCACVPVIAYKCIFKPIWYGVVYRIIYTQDYTNIHAGVCECILFACVCVHVCVCLGERAHLIYIHALLLALLSSSWFSVLLKASGQQACYTFHPVSQHVSMEDCSDPSVCFCAGRAVLTGCGILGTIGPKWTQLADFRCRLVTLDIACRKDWTVVCMSVCDSSSFSFHGTQLSETLLRDMSTTNTITLQTFKPV